MYVVQMSKMRLKWVYKKQSILLKTESGYSSLRLTHHRTKLQAGRFEDIKKQYACDRSEKSPRNR